MSGSIPELIDRGRRRRGFVLVAAHTAWLWLLLPAATTVADGRARPALPSAAGLIVFVLLYLALVAVPVTKLPVPPALHHAGLALLALLGIGLAAVHAADSDGWLTLLLYVCSAGAMGLTRPAWAFAWAGGSVAAVLLIAAAYRLPAGDITPTALITALAGASAIAFVHFVRLVDELRHAQRELARTVVERERLRFAQDLHDLLGHTLSLIVVKAEVVRRLTLTDPRRAAAEAADIEGIGRTALTEVREAVTGYRGHDFRRELANARTVLADVGIDVTVTENGHPLGAGADDAFRWVLREAVTNVLRHSRATRCDITVSTDVSGSTLTISDNGVGGEPTPGTGLRGLTERLEQAGGTLNIGAAPGGGLRFTARIPAARLEAVTR
ncbi:sensor histidine kinase [Actinoplanes sp. NEAU-A12]|uniref:Sensor histidine kinase n=1 Tax=Actinoplanes sandaracinus TaxID=3045177 RepID=A0ABT6WWW6_9ACTN|nr:sensor histidine kinase [Actinoplanes sandaracinus]MDI6104194.1 sensor histidine kinase [Actinoplanes sandaracinus]